MNKEDMILLIEAEESFNALNDMFTNISDGFPIKNERLNGLYNIYDILYRSSRYADMECDDTRDFDPEEEFRAIIYAINKTPEEKYELLVGR